MAMVNKVFLLGRLTRPPESRTFPNTGGKVVTFGLAVSRESKKDPTTGEWIKDPNTLFIDCKVFNRGENGRQADLAEQSLQKGHQVFLEGHLVLESWPDKQSGENRTKHVLYVDNFQFLEKRQADGANPSTSSAPAPQRTTNNQRSTAPARVQQPPSYPEPDEMGGMGGGEEDPIPF